MAYPRTASGGVRKGPSRPLSRGLERRSGGPAPGDMASAGLAEASGRSSRPARSTTRSGNRRWQRLSPCSTAIPGASLSPAPSIMDPEVPETTSTGHRLTMIRSPDLIAQRTHHTAANSSAPGGGSLSAPAHKPAVASAHPTRRNDQSSIPVVSMLEAAPTHRAPSEYQSSHAYPFACVPLAQPHAPVPAPAAIELRCLQRVPTGPQRPPVVFTLALGFARDPGERAGCQRAEQSRDAVLPQRAVGRMASLFYRRADVGDTEPP